LSVLGVRSLLLFVMRVFLLAVFIFLTGVFPGSAQEGTQTRKDSILRAHILSGDTIPHIELSEIAILPPRVFNTRRDERRYWRLVYNLKKVLPYSKIVAATVQEVDRKLGEFKTDKERRAYIKSIEKNLWGEYEDDMRKMTVTQGRLLFKLVDRETSKTTYYWLEHYRGKVSAFFWQGIARLFSSNLKTAYDADGEDSLIEELILYIEKGYI